MPTTSSRGFSLAEMLITVAVVGILAAIGTVTTGHIVGKTREQKLFSDVATLNRGVAAFVASGGDLSGTKTAEDVLSVLKRSFSNASRIPGFAGGKIDERLSFTLQSPEEALGDAWRAYWSAEEQSFVLSREGNGAGIKAFRLDALPPSPGAADGAEPLPPPKVPLLYAEISTWIWDYAEAAPSARPGPSDIPVGETPDTAPAPPAAPPTPAATTPLAVPAFSIASGNYPISAFDLPLALHNPNPPGSSELYYSVDFGNWRPYSGPIQVPPGAVVAAQAIASNELYRNSSRVDQTYAALPADLVPPLITPSRPEFGLFTGREITVTLTNLNPSAISQLEYRIGGDPWQTYTGPFTLDRSGHPSGAFVQARSVPLDPNYLASTSTLRTLGVETPSIAGQSTGSFSNPTGERNLLTNLAGGGSSDYFAWGRDYLLPGESMDPNSLGQLKQSSLQFEGLSFHGLSSGERFEIGTLSYYNGTILSGTGADSITFSADLDFTMNGVAVGTSFLFDFELVNVVNQNNPNDLWADADYVRLASPTAGELLDFNGILYQFQLEFGESTPAGVSLFDEFHVLEGRSATTKLYGTLVEVGAVNFNR